MSNLTQRLSVSALLAANEALIESGVLPEREDLLIRRIIASVRESFEDAPPVRLPTLIIADPDFDAVVERVAIEIGAE